ncbi:MAG: NfeD family protein [Planctomycetia bacterium]|nr:NfeD family protein [Planctomycetia bacterium]
MEQTLQFFQELTLTGNLIFWMVLAIAFILVEAVSVVLVAVWFLFGALAAIVALFCGASLLTQAIIFVVVSAVTFIFVRPIAVKLCRAQETPTNVDTIVGMEGMVLETVDNLCGSGRVKVNGLDWSAKSENGLIIPKETIIVVKKVEGVTLTVASRV